MTIQRVLPTPLALRLLAVLFLGTAALKVYGVAADPIARRGVFAVPELQLLVVEIEVVFGLWVLFAGGGDTPWRSGLPHWRSSALSPLPASTLLISVKHPVAARDRLSR